MAFRCHRDGGRAVLGPDASAHEVVASIEAAAAGLAVMDPRELEPLLTVSAAAPAPSGNHTERAALTAREREVLGMIAEGAPTRRSPGSWPSPITRRSFTWRRFWPNSAPARVSKP